MNDKIQKWIGAPDSSLERNAARERVRMLGDGHDDAHESGAWILDDPLLRRWIGWESDERVMWIYGKCEYWYQFGLSLTMLSPQREQERQYYGTLLYESSQQIDNL